MDLLEDPGKLIGVDVAELVGQLLDRNPLAADDLGRVSLEVADGLDLTG